MTIAIHKEKDDMRISVIKSANEVVIGSLQITNQKLAKFMITLNDIKNNLKRRRHTHWVKVSFEGLGSIEMGDEPMCIGDYDEYPIAPDTKVIIPIEDTGNAHKQYICSTLNTATLLQNKTLTENEEIIIVYTEIVDEESSHLAVNKMLLNAMKKCLFEYQMKVYIDYEGKALDKTLLDKRINQILNILPDLDRLIEQESNDLVSKSQDKNESVTLWEQATYEAEDVHENHKVEETEKDQIKQSKEYTLEAIQNKINEEKDEETTSISNYIDISSDKNGENASETLEDSSSDSSSEDIIYQENIEDQVKWVKIDLKGKNNIEQ